MNRKFHRRVACLLMASMAMPVAVFQAPAAAAQSAQPAGAAQAPGADRLTPSELEELLGPIALYPDPLLANVLAAAVYPEEVVEAAKFIDGGGKAEQVDAKPWEDPVKAVAKIPDAIKMMGQYKDWTVALGQAYLLQAKDVMDVVQSLRKKAQENGALETTPQQKVVVEQEVIYIKPADPEIIYVPTYSPSVVYVQQQPSNDAVVAGVVGFGLGVATGLILANNLDCDWHGGCVGYGYHGGDVNINNNVNVNRNTNINSGNTNISGNNIGNTANAGNRVGNEGNAWAPNKSKPVASQQPSQLNQFKGGTTGANRAQVPGGRPAGGAGQPSAAQQPARTGGAGQAGAAQQPARAGGAGQPSAAQQPARPAAQPAARPATPSASSRVPAAPPRQSTPSAFSGGSGTQATSERGNASRSQSTSGAAARSTPSSGGAARSAPARSSGGGGGGGGRR
jgi:hypothetical protein